MGTLTYQPDFGVNKTRKPRVIIFKMGDGYEARRADGLNANLQEWSCTFKRETTVADAIDDFFTQMNGVESFNWTTPEGYAGVFVCDTHSKVIDDIGWSTVTATLREVPETALP